MKCKREEIGCKGEVDTEKNVVSTTHSISGHPCSICGLLHTKNGDYFPKPGSKEEVAFFIEGNIVYKNYKEKPETARTFGEVREVLKVLSMLCPLGNEPVDKCVDAIGRSMLPTLSDDTELPPEAEKYLLELEDIAKKLQQGE